MVVFGGGDCDVGGSLVVVVVVVDLVEFDDNV